MPAEELIFFGPHVTVMRSEGGNSKKLEVRDETETTGDGWGALCSGLLSCISVQPKDSCPQRMSPLYQLAIRKCAYRPAHWAA